MTKLWELPTKPGVYDFDLADGHRQVVQLHVGEQADSEPMWFCVGLGDSWTQEEFAIHTAGGDFRRYVLEDNQS